MANSTSGDAVLDRAVRVLQAFDAHHARLSVSALAERAALPRTTAYRLVSQMTDLGLLTRLPDGTYRLGLMLWEMATRSTDAQDLATAALPFMEDVNQVVRHSTQLSILDGGEVLILERLSRPGHAVNPARRAARMPVHLTSMGMVLLAHAAAADLEAYLARHRETVTAKHPELRRELDHIRRQGFASFTSFIDPDTTGISVPVLDQRGRALAALSVVVPIQYDAAPSAVMSLRTAARAISRTMDTGRR
ncbi:IclR family transcriptional regulator [Galactobacter caseinivorans]|uniref:IclR family transcriptional regulator n=1 Tax=Galactobacter caseinivorans TaxID=2676123 RepID=UPI001F1AC04D|nr:IclR family transcriptional regulator [Galactobacter caseinivorans]